MHVPGLVLILASEPDRAVVLSPEATIFLKWARWLREVAYADSNPILLNLDETAIEHAIARRHGYVLRHRSLARRAEGISRAETHAHLTLVALLSAEPELQPLCPQLVLCKDARLTRREKVKLRGMPPPFQWVEGTNGWVTGENFPDVLTSIRRPFQREHAGRPIILLLDAALQHVSDAALAHAARLRIQLLVVPAGLTWLLQPLDTHVFASLKRTLHRLQERKRAASAPGSMEPAAWVDVLVTGVREVILKRNWRHAFVDNGLVGPGPIGRLRLKDAIGCPREGGAVDIVAVPPSEADLLELLGRTRRCVRVRLLGPALRHQERAMAALGAPPAPVGPPPLPPPAEPPVPLPAPAPLALEGPPVAAREVPSGPPRPPVGRRLHLVPLGRTVVLPPRGRHRGGGGRGR